MLNLGDLLTVGLLFFALSFALAVALVMLQRRAQQEAPFLSRVTFCSVNAAAALATWLLIGPSWELLVPVALGLAASVAASRLLRRFTIAGQLLFTTHAFLILVGLLWSAWFIATIPVSSLTRALMFAGYPLLVLTLPIRLIQTFEQWEVLCRTRWLRPRAPLPVMPRDRYPKVSLHVPTYAEPPEVVIATLNALARLRYPNFEVLVIDNNTKDPGLWRPVEVHCRRLGERFRFFHLENWPGAKAGALNFALQQTAPDAELIAAIDSDYQAQPDFLAAIVGYFDDPRMGFVQTPHDYREWEASPYFRMCYWEYKRPYETIFVSRNERGAALIVGTMCLIRRQALEDAGGWSEWCVTEDSELAPRIHALGYTSVYVNTTFGRGLIPETFAGYKRQRFRWTYGPIQELKHHVRLFLPWPFGRPSALTPLQKVYHLFHGLCHLNIGLGFLLAPLGIAVTAAMVVQQEMVPMPGVLWILTSVVLMAELAYWWLSYRVVLGCSLKDTLSGVIAHHALTHTRTMASLRALFTRRMPWYRTNKFKALPMGLEALAAAQVELVLGLSSLLFGVGLVVTAQPRGLLLLLLLGVVYQSLSYLAAPALALLAERDIRYRQVPMNPPGGGLTMVTDAGD